MPMTAWRPVKISAKATPTFHRLGTGVRLAGDRHDARHALDHEVIARPLGIGPVLAEAGDRAIDELRVDGFQAVIVEAIFLQAAHLEVLDHHIGLGRQAADELLAFGLAISMQTDVLPRLAERK